MNSREMPGSAVSRRALSFWLVPAACLAYPLIRSGVRLSGTNLVLALVASAAVYVLAVYLCYGLAGLVYRGRTRAAVGLISTAIVLGLVAGGFEHIRETVFDLLGISLAGGSVGWLMARNSRPLTAYLTGAAVLTACVAVVYYPVWPILSEGILESMENMIENARPLWSGAGMSTIQVEDMISGTRKFARLAAQIVPAATIMAAVTQFSIAYLLFFVREDVDPQQRQRVLVFTHWKIPYPVVVPLIISAGLRVLGGEASRVVADNIILVLSIYYCLAGLSLIEYGLRRFQIPPGIRIGLYVLLIISGFFGYGLTVLLGLIDSFTAWRTGSPEIELKKENA